MYQLSCIIFENDSNPISNKFSEKSRPLSEIELPLTESERQISKTKTASIVQSKAPIETSIQVRMEQFFKFIKLGKFLNWNCKSGIPGKPRLIAGFLRSCHQRAYSVHRGTAVFCAELSPAPASKPG